VVVDWWLPLNVRGQFLELRFVCAGVVTTEEQLATGAENGSNLGCSSTPVASVGSGQFGAGERR
jgi:hypothetical protein